MNRKIFSLLILVHSTNIFCQDICNDINDYKSSQNWIRKVLKIDSKKRKDSIIKLIKCNRELIDESKFKLQIVLDGYLIFPFTKNRDDILNKIKSENLNLVSSVCENEGFYPQRCDLGSVLLKTTNNLVFNDFQKIEFLKTKKTSRKKKIYLNSKSDFELQISSENFGTGLNKTKRKKIISRGKNIIQFEKKDEIQLILLENYNKKMIIII